MPSATLLSTYSCRLLRYAIPVAIALTFGAASFLSSTVLAAPPTKVTVEPIDLTGIPANIAFDAVVKNSDGSPSLIYSDREANTLNRLRNGKVEHIAGNGKRLPRGYNWRSNATATNVPVEVDQILVTDRNGHIYISYRNSIFVIKPESFDPLKYNIHKLTSGPDDEVFMGLCPLGDGSLLVSGSYGLRRIDRKSGNKVEDISILRMFKLTKVPNETSIDAPQVDSLTVTGPTKSGDFIATDHRTNRIFRLERLKGVSRVAGQGDPRAKSTKPNHVKQAIESAQGGFSNDGTPAIDALLNRPDDAVEAADGRVIFLDRGNLAVRAIDHDGKLITIADRQLLASGQSEEFTRVIGTHPANDRGVLLCMLIAENGDIYVSQPLLSRVLKIRTHGAFAAKTPNTETLPLVSPAAKTLSDTKARSLVAKSKPPLSSPYAVEEYDYELAVAKSRQESRPAGVKTAVQHPKEKEAEDGKGDSKSPAADAKLAADAKPAANTKPAAAIAGTTNRAVISTPDTRSATKFEIESIILPRTGSIGSGGSIALDCRAASSDKDAFFFFDLLAQKLFRISNGHAQHIAGNGTDTYGAAIDEEEGKPALETSLAPYASIAVSPNGRIVLTASNRIDELFQSADGNGQFRIRTVRKPFTQGGKPSNWFYDQFRFVSCVPIGEHDLLLGHDLGFFLWHCNPKANTRCGDSTYNNPAVKQLLCVRTVSDVANPDGTGGPAAAGVRQLLAPLLRGPNAKGELIISDKAGGQIVALNIENETAQHIAGREVKVLPARNYQIAAKVIKKATETSSQNNERSSDGTLARAANVLSRDASAAPDGRIVFIEHQIEVDLNSKSGSHHTQSTARGAVEGPTNSILSSYYLRSVDHDGTLKTIVGDDEMMPRQERGEEDPIDVHPELVVTEDGDFLLANVRGGQILKIKTFGDFASAVSVWGGQTNKLFKSPITLCPVSQDKTLAGFWVCDPGKNRVLFIDRRWKLQKAIGVPFDLGKEPSYDPGDGDDSARWRLLCPIMAARTGKDETGKRKYLIADRGINEDHTGFIRMLSADGKSLTTLAGNGKPHGGNPELPANTKAIDIAIVPEAVHALKNCADGTAGGFLVADALRNAVLWVKGNGDVDYLIGGGAKQPSPEWQDAREMKLGRIVAVKPSKSGALLVDKERHSVYEVDWKTHKLRVIAGKGRPGYDGDDDDPTFATLNEPSDVTTNSHGDIVIADSGNHVLRQITQTHTKILGKSAVVPVITTIAGTGKPGNTTHGDDPRRSEFNRPTSVFTHPNGNIYVVDSGNAVLKMIKPKAMPRH